MVCRIKNRHTFKSLPILNSAYFTECRFVIRHITQTDTETETEANFTHSSYYLLSAIGTACSTSSHTHTHTHTHTHSDSSRKASPLYRLPEHRIWELQDLQFVSGNTCCNNWRRNILSKRRCKPVANYLTIWFYRSSDVLQSAFGR